MQDSSADRAAILGKIRPSQIYAMLDIIHRTAIRKVSFIKGQFEEGAQHFSETLQFLKDIGWLHTEGERIQPTDEAVSRIAASSGNSRDALFVGELFDRLGPYERMLADYLSQYTLEDDELRHRPSVERRLQEANPRDFLMGLGAVIHRPQSDTYVVSASFAYLALWARNVRAPAVNFILRAQGQVELGRAAELAALDWEKDRVGGTWRAGVRHISDKYPAACFDIQSVTIDGDHVEHRFIEVKAVAADSQEFHWSRAEIEAARILNSRYFLYLVPVRTGGVPDCEGIEVVQNPYSTVYLNPAGWCKVEADIVCRKRDHPVS